MSKTYTQAQLDREKQKSYDDGVKAGVSTAQVMSTADRRGSKSSLDAREIYSGRRQASAPVTTEGASASHAKSLDADAIYAARRAQSGSGR